jgi:hypothetical protein
VATARLYPLASVAPQGRSSPRAWLFLRRRRAAPAAATTREVASDIHTSREVVMASAQPKPDFARMTAWRIVFLSTVQPAVAGMYEFVHAAGHELERPVAERPPGDVVRREGGALLVRCGEDALWVLEREPWRG